MQNRSLSMRRPGPGLRALTLCTTMLACLLWAPPAHAHVELVGSTPAAGDVVAPDTEQVVLVFGDDLLQAVDVVVRDRTGTDVVHDEPVLTGGSVEVEIDLVEPGRHDVSYRLVGLDGHPIVGSFSFRSARPVDAPAGRRAAGGTPDERGAAAAGQVRQSALGSATPALLPSAGRVEPEQGVAWLPWTLAAAVLAGLLLVLRAATARTAVVRAESRRSGPADGRADDPRGQHR